MVSISSLPALGPEAKNTAGSPGSTRISRNVKTSTPNSAGSDDAKRRAARFAVEASLVNAPRPPCRDVDASGDCCISLPRQIAKPGTPCSAPGCRLWSGVSLPAEVAIVDLAVELVGIAFERGRHHRILARLPEHDLRRLLEMDGVELLAVFLV